VDAPTPTHTHARAQKEGDRCAEFLSSYAADAPVKGAPRDPVYKAKLIQVARRETVKFEVALGDVLTWDGEGGGADFERAITGNAKRYQELFSKAIDRLLPAPASADVVAPDVLDVLMMHRVAAAKVEMRKAKPDENPDELDVRTLFPATLYRRYEVRFLPTAATEPLSLRGVRAGMLGQLVTIKCIVIRASDIKPLATLLTYTWCVWRVCVRASALACARCV